MSDAARKDFTEKAEEKITPDSQKTTFDKIKETGTSTTDSIAGAVQPEGEKSTTQKLSDSVSTKPGEKGYVETAQEKATEAYNYVKDTANDAINKISESTK